MDAGPTPRNVSVDPISAAGFARGADVHERARPEYPDEAVEWTVRRLELGPRSVVLDLAAGTGKLTRALVEAIPLEDAAVDAVTVAHAFHWFEAQSALREIHRVLRAGGALALLWNSREPDDPVHAAWEEVVRDARGSIVGREALDERAEIARSGLFGPLDEFEHQWTQRLGLDEFVDLVGSRSYVARLDDPERERVLAGVRGLGERLGEPIPFRYVTTVHVARRREHR